MQCMTWLRIAPIASKLAPTVVCIAPNIESGRHFDDDGLTGTT